MMRKILSYPGAIRDWLLANNQPYVNAQCINSNRPTLYFVFCLLSYCLYLLAMQSGWVLSGAMWAESATTYFPNSSSSSIAVRFFSLDAGYIPLPQRILASIGNSLNLPATAIPYFYTWSGILITGGMVGAICLKPFRALIKSDALRFLAALAVLLVADFETRTFINFTYFVAFFVAIVTALAFAEKTTDVPRWTWVIPILMVSKPAVLSALPAMILAAFVSKTRFRLITLITTILCLVQIKTMYLNPGRAYLVDDQLDGIDKLHASIKYFLGFLSVLFAGKAAFAEYFRPIGFGFALLLVCLYAILRRRTGAGTLILAGLGLLFFNAAVLCFAVSARWNINMERLADLQIERHTVVGYFGVVLVVVGLIATFVESETFRRPWTINFGPAFFLLWFIFSGWFFYSCALNKTPGLPALDNSQWQAMSAAIDSGQSVCVPTDPLGSMFQRNCRQLNSKFNRTTWRNTFRFERAQTMEGGVSVMDVEPPPSAMGNNLISLAVLLKPQAAQSILFNTEAMLKLKDGTVRYLIGSRQLPASGGLVMLTGVGSTPVGEIQSATLKFSAPVELGFSVNGAKNIPVVFWMGN